jgi:hypothetical protein
MAHRAALSSLPCILMLAAAAARPALAYNPGDDMFAPANLAALGCAGPTTNFYVVDTGKPRAVFYPGEKARLVIRVTRGDEPLKTVVLRMQEVTTRNDRYVSSQIHGMSPPPALEVRRQIGAVTLRVRKIEDRPGATADLPVTLPLPKENGCYVVTLAPNGRDPVLLCSLVRTFLPVAGRRNDTPIMGEFGWFAFHPDDIDGMRRYIATFARLGFKTARHEFGAMQGMTKDGSIDWAWADNRFKACEHPDYATWPMRNVIADYWRGKSRDAGFTWTRQPYGYIRDFWPDSPIGGDRFQFALDVIPGYGHHGIVPDTDRVTEGFHAMPDSDYEYSAYDCPDGGTELWRHLAPGVPRGHYMPHQPRASFDQGPVPDARLAVKRDGKFTTYELAVPRSELKDWDPRPGAAYSLTFKAGFARGPAVVFGENKSATKSNGLTMHPYWEGKPGCGVRWTLAE